MLADANGDLLVVYEDHEVGRGDIFITQYTPSTRAVGTPTNLSQTALCSRTPSICRIPASGEIFVTWEELRSDGAFELRSSRIDLSSIQ